MNNDSYSAQLAQADDEIDLKQLVRTLLKHKKTILITTAIVFWGSVAYAILATPVYKAKVTFLPPSVGDIAPLNYPGIASELSTATIYSKFEKNLNSITLRRGIFDKMQLISVLAKDANETTNTDAVFSVFNENLIIDKASTKKDPAAIPFLNLTLQGSDPKLIADVLNQISTLTLETTKEEAIRDILEQLASKKQQLTRELSELRVKSENQKQDQITKLEETDKVEREKLEDQIKTLRESAKTKRMDQITVLTEAAKIAESIGLIEKSSLLDQNALVNNERNAFYTELNTQPQPLYLRGSKALRSEIKELTERSSDDPFIPGLRDLQDKIELLKVNRQIEALKARDNNDPFIEALRDKESELALLEVFKIDPNQVRVATLDQAAFPPEKREKPKRSLVVALGAVGGLFLGVIAAFMLNFWQALRLEDEGTA